MNQKYKLIIKTEVTNENITITGSLENEKWELLNNFAQYSVELLETDWVRNGMASNLKLHWREGETIQAEVELPEWNNIIVFLHKIRPFILQNEETNYYKIHSFLYKKIDNEYIRSFLAEQRSVYSGEKLQAMFTISSNEVILNSEEVLLDWLNAYEYHRDKDKKEIIDELHKMIPLEASKGIFLHQLSDKARAIHNLTGLIQVLLDKQTEFNLKVPMKKE